MTDDGTSTHDDPLLRLRAKISLVDTKIVALLAERMTLARSACGLKLDLGTDIYDPAREAAVVRRAADVAAGAGLDAEDVRDLFWRIIRMSRAAQDDMS